MSDIRQRKRDMRSMKKAADKLAREQYEAKRQAEREQRRRERQCFWSWPFGHVWDGQYKEPGYIEFTHCAVCGKAARHDGLPVSQRPRRRS